MSLVDTLRLSAGNAMEKGITVLADGRIAERVTYAELYHDACWVAGALIVRGVRPGDRVAVALPNSVDFARAFFGVLAAGAVAVPLPPPYRFASLDIHVRRIALALKQSRVRIIATDQTMAGILGPVFAAVDDHFGVVDVADLADGDFLHAEVHASSPAMVQYTSGTSGQPKGVVLTHANILANVAAIIDGLAIGRRDVGCSWLPLFHDMGLIGHLLVPVVSGSDLAVY